MGLIIVKSTNFGTSQYWSFKNVHFPLAFEQILNTADQMLIKISVQTGSEVGTFDNTRNRLSHPLTCVIG